MTLLASIRLRYCIVGMASPDLLRECVARVGRGSPGSGRQCLEKAVATEEASLTALLEHYCQQQLHTVCLVCGLPTEGARDQLLERIRQRLSYEEGFGSAGDGRPH